MTQSSHDNIATNLRCYVSYPRDMHNGGNTIILHSVDILMRVKENPPRHASHSTITKSLLRGMNSTPSRSKHVRMGNTGIIKMILILQYHTCYFHSERRLSASNVNWFNLTSPSMLSVSRPSSSTSFLY